MNDQIAQEKGEWTIPLSKELGLLLALSVVLSVGRIILFHSTYFAYLLWNIFLGILPVIASLYLLDRHTKGKLPFWLLLIGGSIWVLLLPNAPYIMTDFIHLGRHGAPIHYDIFLLMSAAILGLGLFVYSLSQMEKIIFDRYGRTIALIKIPGIILLTSIGMYIGRYLRFNSWDIVADTSFFGSTVRNFMHPVHFVEACLFVIPCFIFLCILYYAWREGIEKRA